MSRIGGWWVHAKHLEIEKSRYLYVNTTEINTEQNEGNNNEQFKILKNKVKFELFRPFLDSVKLT